MGGRFPRSGGGGRWRGLVRCGGGLSGIESKELAVAQGQPVSGNVEKIGKYFFKGIS